MGQEQALGVRVLVLGWCLWLLGSWLPLWWLESREPASRWMVFAILVGLVGAWPAYRLSQRAWAPDAPAGPVALVLTDWLLMLMLVQMVIWLLRTLTGWTGQQTLWLDLTLAAWGLMAALVVAWGLLGGTGRRTAAMALLMLLVLGEPAVVLLAGVSVARYEMVVSPIGALWALSAPPEQVEVWPWVGRVLSVALAAGLGLAWLAWVGRWSRRGTRAAAGRVLRYRLGPGLDATKECDMDFITSDEQERLNERLEELKRKRPEITQRIAEARALGDLKENAEYHAAREDQGMNEAEIRRLEERLNSAQVADDVEKPEDMVFLGSTVRLRDLDDESEDLYKLVGESTGAFDADEIEVTTGSPMGEALLKARVGETVRVDLPRGAKRFEVLEIL